MAHGKEVDWKQREGRTEKEEEVENKNKKICRGRSG
jgi:hypothetical protein